jgi:hypothetical protein
MAKGGSRAHAGRKRKPTEMKLLEGTFKNTRHRDEIVTPAVWPEAPASLSVRQRELWDQLKARCAPWVSESDWLSIWGAVSLMDAIIGIQEAKHATPDAGSPLAFKHIVIEKPGADGKPQEQTIVEAKENPLFTAELKHWTALRGYIAIMGLSPVDRAKVQRPGGDEKPANPLDKFLKRG